MPNIFMFPRTRFKPELLDDSPGGNSAEFYKYVVVCKRNSSWSSFNLFFFYLVSPLERKDVCFLSTNMLPTRKVLTELICTSLKTAVLYP